MPYKTFRPGIKPQPGRNPEKRPNPSRDAVKNMSSDDFVRQKHEEKTTLIFGRNAVLEALKADHRIFNFYRCRDLKDVAGQLSELDALIKDKALTVSTVSVSKEEMDSLCGIGANHQGIAAEVRPYSTVDVDAILANARKKGEYPFVLIAESIQDPHNLGAILRTAETAGVHGIIISEHKACGLTDAVVKTAAGAAEYVPVAVVTNITKTIDYLKEQGLWIAAADMDGAVVYDANLNGPIALVIGGEHEGVSRLVREHSDFIVSLPMFGHVTSLNASVTAGIMIYEVVRRRVQSPVKGKGTK